jgi:hypothetical protein
MQALFHLFIDCYKFDAIQPLGDLPGREFILVPVPEAPATYGAGVGGVVANPVSLISAIRVRDIGLKLFDVERTVLAVDAGGASLGLYLKHHSSLPA